MRLHLQHQKEQYFTLLKHMTLRTSFTCELAAETCVLYCL